MSGGLHVFHGLPGGLLDCGAGQLEECLGGPTLLHLPGEIDPPLFVSVLLHGNETSGWLGLRRLLAESPRLRRSLVVFIGNVAAAAAGVRTLPHQNDFNRIWRGPASRRGVAAEVIATLNDRRFFAAIDLHNNTGQNPHYAVVTDLSADNLGLAYLFDDKFVYVREPDTVLTRIFTGHCPAVALELGPVGDPRCEDRAFDYLKRCLDLESVPPADPRSLRAFRSVARVHIADGASFSFAGQDETHALVLTGGMEAVNFHELPTGTEFATTSANLGTVLRVSDPRHRDVTDDYFEVMEGRVVLRRPVVPAMYTTDPAVIRQDCLCYFMERMALDTEPSTGSSPTGTGTTGARPLFGSRSAH